MTVTEYGSGWSIDAGEYIFTYSFGGVDVVCKPVEHVAPSFPMPPRTILSFDDAVKYLARAAIDAGDHYRDGHLPHKYFGVGDKPECVIGWVLHYLDRHDLADPRWNNHVFNRFFCDATGIVAEDMTINMLNAAQQMNDDLRAFGELLPALREEHGFPIPDEVTV